MILLHKLLVWRASTLRRARPWARTFLVFLRQRMGLALLVLLLSLLSPLTAAAFLWLFAQLIDEVFVAQNLQHVPWFLGAYVAVGALRFALDYAERRLDAVVYEGYTQDLRMALYRHVLQLSPGSLGAITPGDVLERLGLDAERVGVLFFRAPVSVLSNIFRALFFGAVLFFISWKLALAALAVAPPLVWLVQRMAARLRHSAQQARTRTAQWKSLAQERLDAAELVHAFHTYEAETERLRLRIDGARRAEVQTVGYEVGLSLAIEIVTFCGGLAVIALAAYEVAAGRMTVGGVLAFLGAIGSLYDPIRSLSQSAARVQRAAVSTERVYALLSTRSRVDSPAAPGAGHATGRGGIELRHVSFAYTPGTPVLQDVSLRIAPGESVAVVGASGSGKSSLIRLLLRLYDPDSGSVEMDGRDLRLATLEQVRSHISTVLQDPMIVAGSVAENIRYGAPLADWPEVRAAARSACADAFVQALPLAYDEPTGVRGDRLSGGQRQRLALARAMLRSAPVLLMDEATAALDGETEELVRTAVAALAGQRTLVVVSHRLAAIRGVDRIVVLERGRIVECGAPEVLLRKGTRCHQLFASQLHGNVIDWPKERSWRAAS